MHLRELWGQKLGLAIALVLAILATARVLGGVSLLPPGVDRNPVGVASASTQVIVDTPRSTIVDLGVDTYSITALTNRALLLGNVMASLPVREHISRRTGIPVSLIKVSSPLTAAQPRVIADRAHQPKTSDILNSTEEYRLSVRANPTVPVLDIYAEAPDGPLAGKLANAAVGGLRDYLDALARAQVTPEKEQVRLVQLGHASGSEINSGAGAQLALLVFLLVFAACCATVLFLARVRRGWRASEDSIERLPAT